MQQAPARRVQRSSIANGAAPRISSAPGQRFYPQGSNLGAPTGSVRLAGGVHEQRPFLGAIRIGQDAPLPLQASQKGPENSAEPVNKGPSARALERRRAWGQLKKMDAEELASYLESIAKRMDELHIPSGIIKKYRDKLDQFVKTAPADAELQMTDQEIAELDAAVLSYEETESKEKAKVVAVAVVAIAVAGIGAAVLL